jgi:hypothetical protein
VGPFLRVIQHVDEFQISGRKRFIEATKATSFDPTRISNIGGLGHNKYWLIGVWLEFESLFVDFSGLKTLKVEGIRSTTWGALVLVIICEPAPSCM